MAGTRAVVRASNPTKRWFPAIGKEGAMRRLVVVLAALLILTAASCGDDDDEVGAGASSPSVAGEEPATEPAPSPDGAAVDPGGEPGAVAPDPVTSSGGAAPAATPRPVGEPATTPPGALGVSVTPGSPTRVTLANGLGRTVYAEDLKTACSIVWLERSSGGTWERVGDCFMERAASVVEIRSGSAETVSIDPAGANLTAGRYRAVFTYRFAPGPEGEEPERAVSAEFELAR